MMSSLYGDALVESGQAVASKANFVAFAKALVQNLQDHPEEWENASLPEFLHGLLGFVENMEDYYNNIDVKVDLQNPGWRVLADILLAARVYE
jgi:heme oxygenase